MGTPEEKTAGDVSKEELMRAKADLPGILRREEMREEMARWSDIALFETCCMLEHACSGGHIV